MFRAVTSSWTASEWRQIAIATAILLAATLPFLNKALHIDDAADLQYATQILHAPLDPFGFELDWDEGPRPAFSNYHPPMKYYYEAVVLRLFPFSELTLHLSYLPFLAAIAWAVTSLATRFGCPPLIVLALWMLGPGFLPGQNVMLDVPTWAFSLTATAWWIRGVDQDRIRLLVMAAVLLGCALITKYSALVYLPVWLVYLMIRGRWRYWAVMTIPVSVFCAWNLWSAFRYGAPHVSILWSSVPGHSIARFTGSRVVAMLVFLGGSLPGALILADLRSRIVRIALAVGTIATLLILSNFPPARRVAVGPDSLDLINLIWWSALLLSGLFLSLVTVFGCVPPRRGTGAPDRDMRDPCFLGSWFGICLLLGGLASPFLAMRRVVEASLVGWILVIRSSSWKLPGVSVCAALLFNTFLGFLVAMADYDLASVYRRVAAELSATVGSPSARVWCYGYWGWYHYVRLHQLPCFVVGRESPTTGTLLVIPDEAAKPANFPEELGGRLRLVYNRTESSHLPLRVMHFQSGAGYYSDSWGPLPYSWSGLPLEVFHFYEVSPRRAFGPSGASPDE